MPGKRKLFSLINEKYFPTVGQNFPMKDSVDEKN